VQAFIDYRTTTVSELDEQFDVIYDVAANLSYFSCRRQLAKGGVYINNVPNLISLLAGLGAPVMRALGGQMPLRHAWVRPSGKTLDLIADWAASGRLIPQVGKVFDLKAVGDAHRLLEAGGFRGKLVMDVSQFV